MFSSLKVNTLIGCESKLIESVTLDIASYDGETLRMLNVYVADCIPASCGRVNVEQYAHLNDVHFAVTTDKNNVSVDLLIGQDNAEALVPLDVRKGKTGEPSAVRTFYDALTVNLYI